MALSFIRVASKLLSRARKRAMRQALTPLFWPGWVQGEDSWQQKSEQSPSPRRACGSGFFSDEVGYTAQTE